MMYGFLIAELIWWQISKKDLKLHYRRTYFWIMGMIGAFLPDFDVLSSIFWNLIYFHYPWTFTTLEIYHHIYTHGLIFSGTSILCIILSYDGFEYKTMETFLRILINYFKHQNGDLCF